VLPSLQATRVIPAARSGAIVAGVLLSLLGAVSTSAQEPSRVSYEAYTLPNGLSVVLSEDHSVPVVTVNLWYDVGSRNEVPGRSGFAHLFEHLMFQGSAHVKKGEYPQLVERAGGDYNGQTEEDITRYFETLPSNRLNLGLWLEADRMRSLAVTDSNVQNQREVVKEERRLNVDNQPYAGAFVDAHAALFDSASCFAYAHPTIGSMADLDAAPVEDIQRFFRQYYAPDNARLVVTGDFAPTATKKLIADYFGNIPRGAPHPAVACQAPINWGGRRQVITDRLATLSAAVLFYRIPAHDHADTPALELLGIILGQGESSRLTVHLTRGAAATVATQAGIFGTRRGPSAFGTFAVGNKGVSADSLDLLLQAEASLVSDSGVTAEELEKAKNVYRAGMISGRQRAADIAEALHHAATFHGSLAAVNTEFARYLAVSPADIRRVARTYLRADNLLRVLVQPGGAS
jgi:zinc protease